MGASCTQGLHGIRYAGLACPRPSEASSGSRAPQSWAPETSGGCDCGKNLIHSLALLCIFLSSKVLTPRSHQPVSPTQTPSHCHLGTLPYSAISGHLWHFLQHSVSLQMPEASSETIFCCHHLLVASEWSPTPDLQKKWGAWGTESGEGFSVQTYPAGKVSEKRVSLFTYGR